MDAAEDWVIDRLFSEDPLPTSPPPHLLDGDGADRCDSDAPTVDSPAEEGVGVVDLPTADSDDDAPAADVDAGAKRIGAWLGVGVVAASAAIVGGFVLCSGGSRPPTPGAAATLRPSAAMSAAPRTAVPVAAPDQAIPFAAAAPGCKGGSTSAQSSTTA